MPDAASTASIMAMSVHDSGIDGAVGTVGLGDGEGLGDGAVVHATVKLCVTVPVPPLGALTVTVDGVIEHCMLGGLN